MDRYKEDSTRGSARIDPKDYKGDVLVQVWIDGRILATLSNWLESNGYYPRFMSEVVREPLKAIFESLVNSGQAAAVDDTSTARRHLSQRFGVDLSRGGRGNRNVIHNQVLSDRLTEMGASIGRARLRDRAADHLPQELYPQHNPLEAILEGYFDQKTGKPYMYRLDIPGDKERRIAILRKNGIKSMDELKAEAIAIARESGLIVDTPVDKATVVHEGMTLEETERHIAEADAERIALENGPVEEQIRWMREHGGK